jgi:lactose/L-arabinose transport system permease protein
MIQLTVMILLVLFLSVLLNNKTIKFKGFFRTAIFLPCVTSLVAYSVIFKYLFAQDGIINMMLMKISLISGPIQWLTDPFWAKIAIIVAITW